jgi:hypothetical protein
MVKAAVEPAMKSAAVEATGAAHHAATAHPAHVLGHCGRPHKSKNR